MMYITLHQVCTNLKRKERKKYYLRHDFSTIITDCTNSVKRWFFFSIKFINISVDINHIISYKLHLFNRLNVLRNPATNEKQNKTLYSIKNSKDQVQFHLVRSFNFRHILIHERKQILLIICN